MVLLYIISYMFKSNMFSVFKLIGADFVKGLVNRYYSTKRLTNKERNSLILSTELDQVMIGLCLGDLCVRKHTRGINAISQFEQGFIHEAYILHLYDLFKDYCGTGPKITDRLPDFRTGKVYTRITFQTYSLPCFNYYYDLFYVDKVKRIPNNIGNLLTPIGLAYWAMDDGYKIGSGFILSTNSYTLSEVELLIRVLKENFDLNCSYHTKTKDQYMIYIKSDSMDKFLSLVTPHFHSSMMYKLAV